MTEKSPENKDIINQKPSIQEIGDMFDSLFLDPSKKELCVKLFEGIPGITREQAVNEAILASKKGLTTLKTETITV